MQISPDVERSIISQLQHLFHENNDLLRLFKTAIDVMPTDTHEIVISADKTPTRLMIRPNNENYILKCRQLFQQYIVDMYAMIESERFLFIRLSQTKLCSEQYIHLRDAVVNDGNTTNVRKLTILPSSYAGSPRQMHEYAQYAIAYVCLYGRPDLFITFTCNQSWDEIQQLLF